MILFPPCKINLGLNILNKREDGYHNLETIMFQLPFYDVLEIVPSESFTFTSSGIPIDANPSQNLCVKTYNALKNRFDLSPVNIHLHKNIPMGGGLGGGSSDATYVLKGLNELFELNLTTTQLQEISAELGSDCPLFVETAPQLATGRGEILEPIAVNLSGYYLKLVNIGIHVSTQLAFSSVSFSNEGESLRTLIQQPIENWKNTIKNGFESSVFAKFPELNTLKSKLYDEGAVYAAMSGSGSTLFAIYKNEPLLSFSEKQSAVLEKIIYL